MQNTNQSPSKWHRMVEDKIGRRSLLKGLAASSAAAITLAAPLDLRTAVQAKGLQSPVAANLANPRLLFQPIGPTDADELVLPEGYSYNVVAAWEDPMGGDMTVGFNHDWVGYFPIDLLELGNDLNNVHVGYVPSDASSEEGLLVINHEYVNPLFVSGYDGNDEAAVKTPEMVSIEQESTGVTVVHVMRNAEGAWEIVQDAPENRRITGTTPMILDGPAAEIDGGPEVVGTVANCSGGMTPWGTALTCEENFADYPLEAPEGYGWDPEIYDTRHYGWVVEIDPFDPESTPRKHTAMGRFRHENVAVRVGEDGTVVAYMGDDRADCCVYKFVADQKLTDPINREANMSILESGKLYVANFATGAWLLLDYDEQTALQEATNSDDEILFESQVDVLADARAAAIALRATPVDRPEDIEIHPLDGSVFIALTNSTGHGNFFGQIVRLMETDGDPASETFEWTIFAVGGPQSGFASPDNLVFDGEGNLWMVTDISSSVQNVGIYAFQGNNAMFFFRTEGPYAGVAYQFASGPLECEMTGPAWTPDGKTLFLSVQHPGELTEVVDEPTSRWPNGGDDKPRPATVAITGFPGIA